MLVLSRCEKETIVLDDSIEITVLDIRKLNGRKQVRFGITAPKSISIHRKEVQDRISRERLSAVGLQS